MLEMKISINYPIALFWIWFIASATATSNLADVPCGKRRAVPGLTRVINGNEVGENEFPWQMYIMNYLTLGNETIGSTTCSGAVIHKRFVLTAGHCASIKHLSLPSKTKSVLLVVGGVDKVSELSDSEEYFKVKRRFVHPSYSTDVSPYMNDIALLELERDIKWSYQVQPVCLPDKKIDRYDRHLEGRFATVAGWGRVSTNFNSTDSYGNELKKIVVKVLSKSKCRRWYEKETGMPFALGETHLCAGIKSGKKATCQGDSGGPLLVKDYKGKYVAVGTVSGAIGCAKPKLPTIYARVSRYMDWIKETIDKSSRKATT